MIKRRSKIAKLPKDIQVRVNTMLDEGNTYQSVADWLNANGFPGINLDVIYEWAHGGFLDWLREERRTESSRALLQWAAALATQTPGITPHAAVTLFASCQLQELLDHIDVLQAQAGFAENPDNYARCFNSLARFAKLGFEQEKHQSILALKRETLQKQDEETTKPLTAGGRGTIEERLNLM